MSYLNFIKEREIALPRMYGNVSGEMRMEAFKGYEFPKGSGQVFELAGTRRELTPGWVPNLITNFGLDGYGNGTTWGAATSYCHVGTNNTTPQNTDTQLYGWVAYAGSIGNVTCGAAASPPYYGWMYKQYRFNPGFGGGNINLNEVGWGKSTSNQSLSSRCLTVDGGGTPTTVSVLADEYLDVFYRRRNYPAHIVEATGAPTDDQGIINIGGTNYTYTIRPIAVTYGGSIYVGTSVGWGTGVAGELRASIGFADGIYAGAQFGYAGCTLGDVTSWLSNKNGSYNTASGEGSYTGGTYTRELWWQFGIDNGNGTVQGIQIKSSLGGYQMVLDASFTKVQGEVFTWYHDWTWDRKTTWI